MNRSRSPFGVNSHLIQDAGLELLWAAGIKWHRIDIDWSAIEPAAGNYNWSDVDRVVAAAERLDLSLLGVIAYAPPWASGRQDSAAPPMAPHRYVEFVGMVASRYRQRIAAYSIWNEPNLAQFWKGTRDQFLRDIFRPGLIELSVIAPEAARVGPDLSSSKENRCLKDWLPAVLESAGDLLTVISHHQYDGHDTVRGRVLEFERVRAVLDLQGYGHLPMWMTESGFSRLTPERQGQALRELMVAMLERPWWERTFWYDSHGPEWGLLEPDTSPQAGHPRAALEAYRAVIAEAGVND